MGEPSEEEDSFNIADSEENHESATEAGEESGQLEVGAGENAGLGPEPHTNAGTQEVGTAASENLPLMSNEEVMLAQTLNRIKKQSKEVIQMGRLLKKVPRQIKHSHSRQTKQLRQLQSQVKSIQSQLKQVQQQVRRIKSPVVRKSTLKGSRRTSGIKNSNRRTNSK